MSVTILNIERQVKGAVKNYLADFFRLGGGTPPVLLSFVNRIIFL